MTYLAAVAGPHQQGSEDGDVEFCSYCGRVDGDKAARVCGHCGLGVRLRTDARAFHDDSEPFLIVRGDSVISAASATAERELPHAGTLIGRSLLALFACPDGDLAGTVALAASGSAGVATLPVEPLQATRRERGPMEATIASCGEPRAALVVVRRTV